MLLVNEIISGVHIKYSNAITVEFIKVSTCIVSHYCIG